MVKKRDKRNQAKKRKIHFCHHRACHSNLKKSKAMKAHNLARHMHAELLSNSRASWWCTSRSDTPRRAPKVLEGAESAARTPKATNSCAFSAVDWWTHRLSPTEATLTPTVGDFLFHVLSFLSSSCSSSLLIVALLFLAGWLLLMSCNLFVVRTFLLK